MKIKYGYTNIIFVSVVRNKEHNNIFLTRTLTSDLGFVPVVRDQNIVLSSLKRALSETHLTSEWPS